VAVHPLAGDDPADVSGYRLRGRLGAGGMGRVYLAFTPGGRPVAVKVLRPELSDDPQFRARFRQEIAAARRVHGLFTAQLLDGDPDGSPPWLATAYVAGPSLAQAVTDHGPLPAQAVLLLMAGVAEALAAIHAAGLVHRDLKPSNVLLAADGPRVIDFGIARAAGATVLTRAGMLVGSPQYMAPEQIRGGEVTAAADVFALGALAAFAVTGRAPFGDGGDAALYRVLHEEPDLGGGPDQVRALAGRCLAKDPAARPTPAQVIEYCRACAPAGTLAFTESWLPPAIAAELTSHAAPSPAVVMGAAPYQGAPPYQGPSPYQGASPYGVPHPGTGPTLRRTLLERDPPRQRRRLSTQVLSALAAVTGVIVGLAAYGLVNLATSGRGHSSTAALDSCLFGTWTGTGMTYPFSEGSLQVTFTGNGPTMIFRSDGTSVIEYGPAATLSARVDGNTYTVTYTGSEVGHYTTRNGTLLGSHVSARGSYTVYDNNSFNNSGPLTSKSTVTRYACSAQTLRLSDPNGISETLARSTPP
jgi:serine/threonine protein kinase